jgi:hypothetical protein
MNNTGWPLESAPYYALVNTLRSVASRARREALEEALRRIESATNHEIEQSVVIGMVNAIGIIAQMLAEEADDE